MSDQTSTNDSADEEEDGSMPTDAMAAKIEDIMAAAEEEFASVLTEAGNQFTGGTVAGPNLAAGTFLSGTGVLLTDTGKAIAIFGPGIGEEMELAASGNGAVMEAFAAIVGEAAEAAAEASGEVGGAAAKLTGKWFSANGEVFTFFGELTDDVFNLRLVDAFDRAMDAPEMSIDFAEDIAGATKDARKAVLWELGEGALEITREIFEGVGETSVDAFTRLASMFGGGDGTGGGGEPGRKLYWRDALTMEGGGGGFGGGGASGGWRYEDSDGGHGTEPQGGTAGGGQQGGGQQGGGGSPGNGTGGETPGAGTAGDSGTERTISYTVTSHHGDGSRTETRTVETLDSHGTPIARTSTTTEIAPDGTRGQSTTTTENGLGGDTDTGDGETDDAESNAATDTDGDAGYTPSDDEVGEISEEALQAAFEDAVRSSVDSLILKTWEGYDVEADPAKAAELAATLADVFWDKARPAPDADTGEDDGVDPVFGGGLDTEPTQTAEDLQHKLEPDTPFWLPVFIPIEDPDGPLGGGGPGGGDGPRSEGDAPVFVGLENGSYADIGWDPLMNQPGDVFYEPGELGEGIFVEIEIWV
ncbi:MAG: hypothetical protein AAFV49_13690 [Pseudomonadota bacterium]